MVLGTATTIVTRRCPGREQAYAVLSCPSRELHGVETTDTHTDTAAEVVVEDRPATLRPYRPADAPDIRRIWRATLAMGAPAPLAGRIVDRYEGLALDWYLDRENHDAGRADVVVVEQDGGVHGYALACLRAPHYDRWAARRAVRWGLRSLLAAPVVPAPVRRFTWLRVRDGLHAWRHQAPAPFPAHLHLNLEAGLRGDGIGHRLVGWMDRRVEAAGLAGFVGEVNVPAGGSIRAIEAAGAQVVDRVPNRTFSWLLGIPVERCMVARALDERTASVPR